MKWGENISNECSPPTVWKTLLRTEFLIVGYIQVSQVAINERLPPEFLNEWEAGLNYLWESAFNLLTIGRRKIVYPVQFRKIHLIALTNRGGSANRKPARSSNILNHQCKNHRMINVESITNDSDFHLHLFTSPQKTV